jgi:hypothetical protein
MSFVCSQQYLVRIVRLGGTAGQILDDGLYERKPPDYNIHHDDSMPPNLRHAAYSDWYNPANPMKKTPC